MVAFFNGKLRSSSWNQTIWFLTENSGFLKPRTAYIGSGSTKLTSLKPNRTSKNVLFCASLTMQRKKFFKRDVRTANITICLSKHHTPKNKQSLTFMVLNPNHGFGNQGCFCVQALFCGCVKKWCFRKTKV